MSENRDPFYYSTLITRYLRNDLSEAEKSELDTWISEDPGRKNWINLLADNNYLKKELAFFDNINADEKWEQFAVAHKIGTGEAPQPPLFRRLWLRAVAAVLLIGAGLLIYQYVFQTPVKQTATTKTPAPDTTIQPGGDKAYLTLSDGSRIILDSVANGNLRAENGLALLKQDGNLAYAETDSEAPPAMHAIHTPNGGQYRLQLADGSTVWLNAASSLRFPTSFPGKNRQVELTGEAYFEIAPKPAQPFSVKVNGLDVQVTGTHFNINAYPDEAATHTTLLEGSVFVKNELRSLSLKPGQQARLLSDGSLLLEKNPDLDEVMAWKNGEFIFNGADIRTIMRQISRWYDVEVSFRGAVSTETFSGIVSRQSNIAKVLRIMEEGGIRFTIEGKKIIVQ